MPLPVHAIAWSIGLGACDLCTAEGEVHRYLPRGEFNPRIPRLCAPCRDELVDVILAELPGHARA
jgi:hypothetical protein